MQPRGAFGGLVGVDTCQQAPPIVETCKRPITGGRGRRSGAGEIRLLWVDDELPHRFPSELDLLYNTGCDVTIACSLIEAARHLATYEFDAILLNLVFPYDARWPEEIGAWGGVVLCHWLRECAFPKETPPSPVLERVAKIVPRTVNKEIPLALFTGYVWRSTLNQIECVLGRRIGICQKIASPDELVRFFKSELLQHSLEKGEV